MYTFTHRCVFSSFSAEEIDRRKQVLKASGIAFDVKMHHSNMQTGAVGQLPEYNTAYDLYVRNEDYERAAALL